MPASVNKFLNPDHFDHDFGDATNGSKVGTLRVKPSSILWKPKGAHQFYSASLDDFQNWMMSQKQVKK